MLYPDMNLQKRTQQNTTRYRTALYLRLSREDGDKTESDSIANQRTLLEAYAADHPELCIVDEFVDDGYSGSNFERPAFQNLFRELEQGTINCILVKDLSRFGRNYIEVGRYLERIFPVMRVRLIAVTDSYDSQSAWKTSDSIMVPMRNLLNDAYCRDISVKIKSQLAVKRKRGDFVGSFATYGYQNAWLYVWRFPSWNLLGCGKNPDSTNDPYYIGRDGVATKTFVLYRGRKLEGVQKTAKEVLLHNYYDSRAGDGVFYSCSKTICCFSVRSGI